MEPQATIPSRAAGYYNTLQKKTLQYLYRFQVIRGPQNSKKRTKRGPNFEQKGDPKGAQMET